MKIRKIKEHELVDAKRNNTRCFTTDRIDSKTSDWVKQQLENPDYFIFDHLRNIYVCTDDHDKIMGQMMVGLENSNFDGNKVPTSLISGVCTLPEYRHMGCIKEIFGHAFPKMYDDGVVASQLFAFSQGYYRNFGYEVCSKEMKYRWRLDCLPDYRFRGEFVPAKTKSHQNDMQKIYAEYIKDFSLALDRNRSNFFNNIEDLEKTTNDRIYTSIYYDTDKRPNAYFSSILSYSDEINYIEIKDMAFTSVDGLKAILSFIKKVHSSNCVQVRFTLSDYFDLSTFLTEKRSLQPYNLVECESALMVRVINVEEMLKKAKYNGTGKISITIEDKQISQNNGIFIVEFQNDKAVSVEHKMDGVSDVFMPINIFSRLIMGDLNTKDILWLDHNQIKYACSLDKLGKVFFKKPSMVTNFF